MAAATSIVFQASDMNRHGRAILDAARRGEARIRDTNGVSLLLLPEEQVQIGRALLQRASNLATVFEALRVPEESRPVLVYGDWTWLRFLDEQDRREFLNEMLHLFAVAVRERSQSALAAFEEALSAWRVTAEAVADPTRRAILLGEHDDADFVEVARPEAAETASA